uniref:Uncharacterized protein n=1 Tax=Heterorhabditis bacteriophora TaxID=37862 RepID=A0A1I7WIJ8_HETBA
MKSQRITCSEIKTRQNRLPRSCSSDNQPRPHSNIDENRQVNILSMHCSSLIEYKRRRFGSINIKYQFPPVRSRPFPTRRSSSTSSTPLARSWLCRVMLSSMDKRFVIASFIIGIAIHRIPAMTVLPLNGQILRTAGSKETACCSMVIIVIINVNIIIIIINTDIIIIVYIIIIINIGIIINSNNYIVTRKFNERPRYWLDNISDSLEYNLYAPNGM